MGWKKHFKVARPVYKTATSSENQGSSTTSGMKNILPEIYAGHPQRLQRYYIYDDMDKDSDINLALNVIADFCTQSEEQTEQPFQLNFNDEVTESEVKILNTCLNRWIKINDFKSRLWSMFRNCLKNGDSFFIRDPETAEWLWVDHFAVIQVSVDEEKGKEPLYYFIKGLDYAKHIKFATHQTDLSASYGAPGMLQNYSGRTSGTASNSPSAFHLAGAGTSSRNHKDGQSHNPQEVSIVKASDVIHLSLSTGLDVEWPFGNSILDSIYKVFKQKELLEDAILIYRVQRSPERRVFYIDVGNMPPDKASAYLQKLKNEVQQRRMPNRTASGGNAIDTAYSPMSMVEDFWFAQSSEGRNSRVETLPGANSLGELSDLDFFTKKMARGLHIPSSYLAIGEGSSTPFNDGKVGTAMIQEFMFNKYCIRLQNLIAPKFDQEFKTFATNCGVNIDESSFELQFNPPQNFSKYRQIDIDQAQANVYQSVQGIKMLSERFKLQRFLGLTEAETLENERLWAEENAAKIKKTTGSTPAEQTSDVGLNNVGIGAGGDAGLNFPGSEEFGDLGGEGEDGGAQPDQNPASGPAAPPVQSGGEPPAQ